jgi:choline dehydrogenase-like flavoprotein
VGGGCHNMGVARMSEDPADGVTNRWGRLHDMPNLFVSGGSVFSSSGAPNPTLTIVALAIRQAGHIAEAMLQREL